MAQIRGSWFPCLRAALDRAGLLAECDAALATTTRGIFWGSDPTAWFDEGHVVAIYEAIAVAHGQPMVRELGRDAARFAMTSLWRDLVTALEGHIGGTPRMAFEQMPVLWSASRRDAGELRCVESSSRHAITEVQGFPYASSQAWVSAWMGHHDALMRHFRFSGSVEVLATEKATEVIRVRAAWGGALAPTRTSGFGASR